MQKETMSDFTLFGERPQPKLVFNTADTQHTPSPLNSLNATLGVNQMAAGNTRVIIHKNNTVIQTYTNQELLELMRKLNEPH